MNCKRFSEVYRNTLNNATAFLDPDSQLLSNLEILVKNSQKIASYDDNTDDAIQGRDRDVVESAIGVISKVKSSSGGFKFNVNQFFGGKKTEKTGRKICDDTFFRLEEMEDYADRIERMEEEGDDESTEEDFDLTKDFSDEDDKGVMFQDFFDPPPGDGDKKEDVGDSDDSDDEGMDFDDFDPRDAEAVAAPGARNLSEASDSDDEDNNQRSKKTKTPLDEKLEQENKRIKKLENDSLAAKSWQLSGETTGNIRPENSLLEEHLQFDFISREAPLVTEESTKNLEEVIRNRIKNESWDDVVRKVKPTEEPFEFKRRITLEHEKSKASLAQVYEQEYLKKVSGDAVEDKEDPNHAEIKRMAKTLYLKLNALSSFHFTPTPAEPEVKIINNLPAVSVEEAIPVAVNESTLLAPEEVVQKTKRPEKTESEKTSTDRKRSRRIKKSIQRNKRIHLIEKSKDPQVVTSNRYVKLKRELEKDKAKKGEVNETGKSELRSSRAFFQRLGEEIESIKSKMQTDSKKTKKSSKPRVNAKVLKLT